MAIGFHTPLSPSAPMEKRSSVTPGPDRKSQKCTILPFLFMTTMESKRVLKQTGTQLYKDEEKTTENLIFGIQPEDRLYCFFNFSQHLSGLDRVRFVPYQKKGRSGNDGNTEASATEGTRYFFGPTCGHNLLNNILSLVDVSEERGRFVDCFRISYHTLFEF